ncbi:AbrB/MazE/SpoVT family DNA-binding domain-containing protein [Spinactinospora alkalitolerans]|uniref:AbrB/MazE/SpoVT family DNA-binding domain-containing protein n=1 Tax=Spinactinospora alkalitolerans TaxID=687207 RepID=UPI0035E455B6
MIREPAELTIGESGQVVIPLGVLAEAGLDPGSHVLVFSGDDGCLIIRRAEDAMRGLLEGGHL